MNRLRSKTTLCVVVCGIIVGCSVLQTAAGPREFFSRVWDKRPGILRPSESKLNPGNWRSHENATKAESLTALRPELQRDPFLSDGNLTAETSGSVPKKKSSELQTKPPRNRRTLAAVRAAAKWAPEREPSSGNNASVAEDKSHISQSKIRDSSKTASAAEEEPQIIPETSQSRRSLEQLDKRRQGTIRLSDTGDKSPRTRQSTRDRGEGDSDADWDLNDGVMFGDLKSQSKKPRTILHQASRLELLDQSSEGNVNDSNELAAGASPKLPAALDVRVGDAGEERTAVASDNGNTSADSARQSRAVAESSSAGFTPEFQRLVASIGKEPKTEALQLPSSGNQRKDRNRNRSEDESVSALASNLSAPTPGEADATSNDPQSTPILILPPQSPQVVKPQKTDDPGVAVVSNQHPATDRLQKSVDEIIAETRREMGRSTLLQDSVRTEAKSNFESTLRFPADARTAQRIGMSNGNDARRSQTEVAARNEFATGPNSAAGDIFTDRAIGQRRSVSSAEDRIGQSWRDIETESTARSGRSFSTFGRSPQIDRNDMESVRIVPGDSGTGVIIESHQSSKVEPRVTSNGAPSRVLPDNGRVRRLSYQDASDVRSDRTSPGHRHEAAGLRDNDAPELVFPDEQAGRTLPSVEGADQHGNTPSGVFSPTGELEWLDQPSLTAADSDEGFPWANAGICLALFAVAGALLMRKSRLPDLFAIFGTRSHTDAAD